MTKPGAFWSYAAICAVGNIALSQLLKAQDFFGEYSYCTFAVIAFYGFLGMLICGKQSPSAQLIRWHDQIRLLIANLAIPCYTTDILLKYGILQEQIVAVLYTALGCIPALMCILGESFDAFFIDGLVYTYCTTISAVSCQNGNIFGVLGATCFMMGYHHHRRGQHLLNNDQNLDTAFNLFTTAFAVCAFASLKTKTPKVTKTCASLLK